NSHSSAYTLAWVPVSQALGLWATSQAHARHNHALRSVRRAPRPYSEKNSARANSAIPSATKAELAHATRKASGPTGMSVSRDASKDESGAPGAGRTPSSVAVPTSAVS